MFATTRTISKNEHVMFKAWSRKGALKTFSNHIRSVLDSGDRICLHAYFNALTPHISIENIRLAFQQAYDLHKIQPSDIDVESFFAEKNIQRFGQYVQWCRFHHLQPNAWDNDLVEMMHKDTHPNMIEKYKALYYVLHVWTNRPWNATIPPEHILRSEFPLVHSYSPVRTAANITLPEWEQRYPKWIKREIQDEGSRKESLRDVLMMLLNTPKCILQQYGYNDQDLERLCKKMSDSDIFEVVHEMTVPNMPLDIDQTHWMCLIARHKQTYIPSEQHAIELYLAEKETKIWEVWNMLNGMVSDRIFYLLVQTVNSQNNTMLQPIDHVALDLLQS